MRFRWIGAIGLALLAAACVQDGPVEPVFDQSFPARDRAAQAPNPSWQETLRSDCDTAPDGKPMVCVRGLDKASYRKGEPIRAELVWRDVPEGFGLVVYLQRDDGRDFHTLRYLGNSGGALVTRLIYTTATGSKPFEWNGTDFPCAPSDFPMICKGSAEVGRYRLRVALWQHHPDYTVGWVSRTPSTLIRFADSTPFTVTGTPDLQPIAHEMWWAAVNRAMAAHEVDSSSAFEGDSTGKGLKLYERPASARICAMIPLAPPYVGEIEACVPKAKLIGDAGLLQIAKEDVTVTGQVRLAAGAIGRKEAIQLAQAVADKPYLSRVAFHRQPEPREAGYVSSRDGDFYAWSRKNPHATTHLADSVSETVYRPDLGGGWAIVVNEIMAGGSVPDGERFADKVLVFVTPDRRACVIETAPYKGVALKHDPASAVLRC